MLKFVCIAPALAIAACATSPGAPPPPNPGADGSCEASGTARFVGQMRSNETGAAILAATGSRQIRWVTPGMMVTMEFLSTRVTVHLDADSRITRIVCG